MRRFACLFATVALAVAISSCGGSSPKTPPPPPPSISITPGTVLASHGQSIAFTATVRNSTGPVVWSLQETQGATVDTKGVFVATKAGTFHVVASLASTPTVRAIATVNVPEVSISLSPDSASLPVNTIYTFAILVEGTVDTGVTVSVQEGDSGGTVKLICCGDAIYSAPAVPGTYHIVITSVADPTKSATIAVVVTPPVLTINPANEILGPAGTRQFSAYIAGLTDQGVVWSVEEGPTGGSIDSTGLYTAPPTQGTYHVMAISTADITITGTAAITVGASGFRLTGSMVEARIAPTATLLQDGRVLVTGGRDSHDVGLASAEIYDPATETFAATTRMSSSRFAHTATLLPNGKVLIAGGVDDTGSPTASAELFDPTSNTFTATGSMLTAREGHTATLLPDGRVLIIGGHVGTQQVDVTNTAEIYDPATGEFSQTGQMITPRWKHTSTLLKNGKVLVVAGLIDSDFEATGQGELFDPATGQFSETDFVDPFGEHAATLLQDGSVLITGGHVVGGLFGVDTEYASAALYDPTTGIFTFTNPLNLARFLHTATLLPNGSVLIAGGDGFQPLASAELYDPVSGTFQLTASMPFGIAEQAAVLLQDGRVLVVGGVDGSGNALSMAQIYH